VHTSSFSIEPEKSKSFKFEWVATGNYHEFEIKSYVNDGEVNKDNNGYSSEEIFESERKSGFLPSISMLYCVTIIGFTALLNRSKPN
jgi:hypothetical protein